MNDLIGRIISDRYRVDSFLGKGGMAEVYKVWDQKRSVFLAMKILYADLAEDKIFLRRFRREAQALADLQHPNIVRFYGLERDGDLVFILMDYVDGTTLRKEIFHAKEPFSAKRIMKIMRPVCAALGFAHQSGFVHCDVKPANIMINTNGTVLVSDFGIARMTDAATATMVGAGTPAYMAPEQARGDDPTPQTDIYALGVMLFEMLSGGERPFTGENARTTGSTSEKIRWEQMNLVPPLPSQFNPTLSKEWQALVLKCLEKDPKRRFDTIFDLRNSLETLGPEIPKNESPSDAEQQQKTALTKPEKPITPAHEIRIMPNREHIFSSWSPSITGLFTIIILIIVIPMLYWFFINSKQSQVAVSDSIGTYLVSDSLGKSEIFYSWIDRTIQITNTPRQWESWSPASDGHGNLYFTSNQSGRTEIYAITTNGKLIKITNTPGQWESWSPALDGHGNLYFASNQSGKTEIYAITTNGKLMKITNTPGRWGSWSPASDGYGNIYFTSNQNGYTSVFMMNTLGELRLIGGIEDSTRSVTGIFVEQLSTSLDLENAP